MPNHPTLSSDELRNLLDDISKRLCGSSTSDRDYIDTVNTILAVNRSLANALMREDIEKEKQKRQG